MGRGDVEPVLHLDDVDELRGARVPVLQMLACRQIAATSVVAFRAGKRVCAWRQPCRMCLKRRQLPSSYLLKARQNAVGGQLRSAEAAPTPDHSDSPKPELLRCAITGMTLAGQEGGGKSGLYRLSHHWV